MKRLSGLVFAALLVFLFTLTPYEKVFATEGGGSPEGFDDGGASTPIDGGLSILLVAGVAYGAKKGYDSKRRSTNKHKDIQGR